MSSFKHVQTVMELTQQGWEALRFPQPADTGEMIVGGVTYLANAQREMLVVDSTGNAYLVDISLLTAQRQPPVYTPKD